MIARGKKEEVEVIHLYKIVVVRTCILKFLHSDPPVVGKEEQGVNFVDSTLISLIKAKIDHSFDIIICTYPDNKQETLFVPCKRSLDFLMDFHSEIYEKCMFVNLTFLMMEIFP
jgi:hypothetical protein